MTTLAHKIIELEKRMSNQFLSQERNSNCRRNKGGVKMQDHDKYLIELKLFGQEKKFYIAIEHSIPETEINLLIKEEVFQFLERETRFNFSRILL